MTRCNQSFSRIFGSKSWNCKFWFPYRNLCLNLFDSQLVFLRCIACLKNSSSKESINSTIVDRSYHFYILSNTLFPSRTSKPGLSIRWCWWFWGRIVSAQLFVPHLFAGCHCVYNGLCDIIHFRNKKMHMMEHETRIHCLLNAFDLIILSQILNQLFLTVER